MNCPICKGGPATIARHLYDDRYGYPSTFVLYQCGGCGHRFLQTTLSADDLVGLYTNYYPRGTFGETAYRAQQPSSGLRAWWSGDSRSAFRWVSGPSRVLDIGCGSCESLGYLRALGCEVHGVEADENVRAVADQQGFDVHIGPFDPDRYAPEYFDYVTMDQVIEHVIDPLETLYGIARILKPGGTAILSTPNASGWGSALFGRYWINWHAPYHLHFFTRHSMQCAAEQAGLVMGGAAVITPSAWLHYQWLHLLSYPRAGQPSVFWAGVGEWRIWQKVVRRLLSTVHAAGVNHVLTRVFDALGVGDNRVFVLRRP